MMIKGSLDMKISYWGVFVRKWAKNWRLWGD